jgi:hypothetical protein
MKKRCGCTIFLLLMFIPYFSSYAAAQSWVEDFDKICAQAEVADSLPTATLKELALESDKLLLEIETSNDPRKKVFTFRLKKCRNLFVYIMDLREAKQRPAPP